MKYEMVFTVAAICFALTLNFCQSGYGDESKLADVYQRFVDPGEQSLNLGWIPRVEEGTEFSTHTDAPAGTFPREGTEHYERRESLRRLYTGSPAGDTDSYFGAYASFTSRLEEVEHDCPPNVCKNGDCQANYVAMFSMSWCGPCHRMYPVIKELRKEGYLIYVYVCDSEDFKDMDLDAKFDVESFPTFIVFDKGKEVKRKIGVTNKDWFKENLKTRKEQEEVKEPDNPYDGL